MKQPYSKPELKCYDSFTNATQVIGSSPATDAVIFNGKVIDVGGHTDGSSDLIF